ncbi:beta-scruin-like [Haemaphysalis longicornis]
MTATRHCLRAILAVLGSAAALKRRIPIASDEGAAEAWLSDPLLHEILQSRALTERLVEWDEYAAKALPEDSRIRRGSPGLILVGGIDPLRPHQVLTGCAVLAYEEADDRWHRVAMLPEPRHHHAGAIVGDDVYIIGGLNSRRTLTCRVRPLGSCLCYQLGQRQWHRLPDLQVARAYHGCATVANTLFAVGGRDRRGRIIGSVEYLDPGSDQWQLLAKPLKPGRMGAAVASSGEALFVAGGISRSDDGRLWLLADVDCYDLQAKRWFRGPRLPWPVCFGALVTTSSGVLIHLGGLSLSPTAREKLRGAVGGAFQEAAMATEDRNFCSRSDVLFWDPASPDGRWKSLRPLPEPRHGIAATVCANEDTLYALGGLSTSSECGPLEVLAASTADSGDRSFYRACQLPGPIAGTLALPLPNREARVPADRRRSSSC